MSSFFRLIAVASTLALAACASTSIHYHTLLPPVTHDAAASSPAPFVINVLPVDVPAQLDQSSLVVRQGQSGIAVLDGERWASPFGDEVRGALSSALVTLLNTQDVAGFPVQSNQPQLRVKVHIRRFDAWPGRQVQLVADWELGVASNMQGTRVIHTGCFDETASGDYAAMTSAYQRAVMDLAARIAADARAVASSRRIETSAAAADK